MSNELRNFLALSYDELEDLNLKAKEERKKRVSLETIREERLRYLTDEKRIKALTVLFSDLEGRLHMGQPDLRRIVHSRLYRAARKRPAPRYRLERLLLGSRRCVWPRQSTGVR
jgi:hypothetical protein